MTDKQADDAVKAAWSKQRLLDGHVDLDRARAAIHRREAEIRRRDRIIYGCAAIIAPSWAAVMWFMPDLRVMAAIGFAVAVWIAVQMYTRSAARLGAMPLDAACVEFQRALLQRERDLWRAMPLVYLAPVVLSQAAILFALFTSPRFPRTPAFPLGVAAFIGSTVTVLAVASRRWRREAADAQRELDALDGERP